MHFAHTDTRGYSQNNGATPTAHRPPTHRPHVLGIDAKSGLIARFAGAGIIISASAERTTADKRKRLAKRENIFTAFSAFWQPPRFAQPPTQSTSSCSPESPSFGPVKLDGILMAAMNVSRRSGSYNRGDCSCQPTSDRNNHRAQSKPL